MTGPVFASARDLRTLAAIVSADRGEPPAEGVAPSLLGDLLALVRCGAAPYVVVDLQLVGGITLARRCAAIAQAAGLSASLLGGPSVGIGAAAMLQLAASTPAFSSCNECVYHRLQDDVLTQPLEILDGMVTVPQAPGLGVEVDRVKVERSQVS